MTTQEEAGRSGDVVRLERPPIRQAVVVEAGVEHVFDVFVHRLDEWWPLVPFSKGGDRVRRVTVEGHLGGQVVEVWDDGTSWPWGEIVAWERPEAFAMTWNITGTPTEVELRFRPLAPSVTRVELEHRGWERLTEAELGDDCAAPGGYLGGAFHEGWREILGRFKRVIDGVDGTDPDQAGATDS